MFGILEGLELKLERIISRQEEDSKNLEEVKTNLSALPTQQAVGGGGSALANAQPQNRSASLDPLKE
jgi:hypothetical protein